MYRGDLREYGQTTATGVEIGPRALRSEPMLRSTIIHEDVHVRQLRTGNYPHWRSDVAGYVSEAEAYREELLLHNVQRTGLSPAEQEFVAGEYKKRLLDLQNAGARGDYYLRRILIIRRFLATTWRCASRACASVGKVMSRRRSALLLVLLVFACSACCANGDARSARNPRPATSRVWGEPKVVVAGEVKLRLHLRPVEMLGDSAYTQGLEIELESDMRSADWIWLNSRMAQSSRDGGEIEIIVTGDDGQQIGDECRRKPAPIEPWDYMVLAPGESVTRVAGLQCFDLAGKRQVRIQVVYRDANPNPPRPLLPHLRTFREKLVSNAIVLEWPG
jgi:phosphotransferase system HPr-like phosphotransfer protein